jgi:folate-binding protein YgfZ
LQSHTVNKADQFQLDALEKACGMIRWGRTAIVEHTGPDALDLLNRLTTRELLSVGEGHSRRTALASVKGRVVDVFLVANISKNRLLLISDSGDSERLVSAIDYYTIIEDAELADLSETHARISLVGPDTLRTVKMALGVDLEGDGTVTVQFGDNTVTVTSDNSRGVEWVDVICESAVADALAETFENAGGTPVGADNFEHFRIAHEIPGSDREYGEHANPIEAGLLPLIDWDKGCYVGQEVVARLDAYDKVQRAVKVLVSDSPLDEGAKLASGSKTAGVVTSASKLVTEDGVYLSLALIRNAFVDSGFALDASGITATVQ